MADSHEVAERIWKLDREECWLMEALAMLRAERTLLVESLAPEPPKIKRKAAGGSNG
jgi:hypothetical protein